MLNFASDYVEGAHEKILRRLMETNMEKLPGYGTDVYCESAKRKILEACDCPQGDVHLLVGGTQTNHLVIHAMLADCEGVIAADTGHINVHEAGAIEALGHKVLTIPHVDGKLTAAAVRAYIERFYADESHEHMVFPGMVYISHPTEYGTLYSKSELEALAAVCREYTIPLYMDGARLGYALASPRTDVSLPDIAELCDVFYIGGTKVGALCGEAVVFTKHNTPRHFVTHTKQHGAMLAKGRLLGIQFDTLFTDDLYIKLGRHAMDAAQRLVDALREKGYPFYNDSPTNQIFVVVENERLRELRKEVICSYWEPFDETHSVIRLATSWATQADELEQLIAVL